MVGNLPLHRHMHACTNTDTHTHTHIARTTWILEIIIGSAWVAQVLALRVGRASQGGERK